MELTHADQKALDILDEDHFAEEIGKYARALQQLHASQHAGKNS
jgi:hypothetical protein